MDIKFTGSSILGLPVALISKWDDQVGQSVANMCDEEREEYYGDLYQGFGSLMGVIPPDELPADHPDHAKMKAVTEAYESLLDALAELAAYEG